MRPRRRKNTSTTEGSAILLANLIVDHGSNQFAIGLDFFLRANGSEGCQYLSRFGHPMNSSVLTINLLLSPVVSSSFT